MDCPDERWFPTIAFASTVQFGAGERTVSPHVESRMLLAGVSGRGEINVNGIRVDVTPQTIVVLPWAHHVRYLPDETDPYLVYGAHLIPRNSPDQPVELTVPHRRTDPLTGVPWRCDAELAIGSGLYVTDEQSHPTLKTLLKLVAQVWDRGEPGLETAQALGVLVVNELNTVAAVLPQNDRRLPLRLRQALTWVMADPTRPISMADLAAAADCSQATITRLFRQHLNTTPMAWVMSVRMDIAKRLLTTSRLSVQQISRRVGIEDSYYFSRKFHQDNELSPTDWRRRWAAP